MVSIFLIILEKLSKLQPNCFESAAIPRRALGTWITLGHFDAMYAYKLDSGNMNLFQAINLQNQTFPEFSSQNKFLHPIYLITDDNQTEAFWYNRQYAFFAVVRIHFAESVDASENYCTLKKQLREHAAWCREQSSDFDCRYEVYQTIELSDSILVIKSDACSDILRFVLTLRRYPYIGKVYTYFAINYAALKNSHWLPGEDDRIDLFTMRFSVRDFRPFQKQTETVCELLDVQSRYLIAGVDDVVFSREDLPLRSLIALYRAWFLGQYGRPIPWGEGISDVTTRVGIKLENCLCEGMKSKSTVVLQQKCESIISDFNRIRDYISGHKVTSEDYSWLRPLSELVYSLPRINSTVILDEFLYLMLPAVHAFLSNVYERLRTNRLDSRLCHVFVENWADLTEHIMRIEGQLSQQPEMRPVLYDIPVAMLEYTLAFLQKVSAVLQENDEQKSRISFLLVPRLCSRIAAQELFPAQPNRAPGLVLVSLPLRALYEPDAVQRALCHETSHFVSEAWRQRDFRREKYILSASSVITYELFRSYDPVIRSVFRDLLAKTVKSLKIRDMNREVAHWLRKFYSSNSQKVVFMEAVAAKAFQNMQRWPGISAEDFSPDESKLTRCIMLLRDLGTLYREIYADICMLSLLDIDNATYVQSLAQEFTANSDVPDMPYEQFAIRIYVTLTALKRSGSAPQQSMPEKLRREYYAIEQAVMQDVEAENRRFPIASILYLVEYARGCCAIISQTMDRSAQHSIKDMFENASSSKMNYTAFLNTINDYRKELLQPFYASPHRTSEKLL